jgi:hypothetical protein
MLHHTVAGIFRKIGIIAFILHIMFFFLLLFFIYFVWQLR